MNVLIVYAHPEKKSFNNAMKDLAVSAFTGQGYAVKVSDLYAQKFKCVADRHDFTRLSNDEFIDYLQEQKYASENGTFAEDIVAEMAKVSWADLVLFQFPLWWSSVPSMMKGWFDRVLALGFAWDFGRTYDKALLFGKKAMVSLTTGANRAAYSPQGMNGDIQDVLFPLNHGTLYFCGFQILEPFIAYSVFQISDEERRRYLDAYRSTLETVGTRRTLSYPSSADFDENGRLKTGEKAGVK